MPIEIYDQLNRRVFLEKAPQRIVSLVPSQTELLFDFGIGERVVGLTKFCVHPAGALQEKTIVGGTKQHRFAVIESLQPDLIIANKEENTKENIERLAADYPVYISDVADFSSALAMIAAVGELCGCAAAAKTIGDKIAQQSNAQKDVATLGSVLYLIWKDPYMAAGSDTFISAMLAQAGFQNAIAETRYPKLTLESVAAINPDYIFFSSEPFPFKEKHFAEFLPQFKAQQLRLVDGQLFSWYGSRMLRAFDYFQTIREGLSEAID